MIRWPFPKLAALFLLAANLPCLATPSTAIPVVPAEVKVGLYMVDLYDLSIKDESFIADFYLWMTWKVDFNPENFEFMNGEMEVKDHPDTKKKDGINYICWRCRGKG